jgi:MarR family transcriptional repressor of emrRAB
MRGMRRLIAIKLSIDPMGRALPDLPMVETVMVRVVRSVAAEMTDFFEPVFREIGLSENAFHVLCLLLAAEDRQLSPSDLSDLVGTSRANITKIIESLAVSGYASRHEVKHDGRRQVIAITESGKAAALAVLPKLSRPLKMAFSSLTAEEMAQLDALLRKVVVSFDNGALELDATTIFGNPAKEDGHG